MCGFTGAGFTGSYIFSQTIFSMRAGVNTRVHGAIIAAAEFSLFALPISIVQYLPVRAMLNAGHAALAMPHAAQGFQHHMAR